MKQTRVLPVLFLTLLLDMVGVGMLIPLIPSLFTDPTSSSFLLAGYTETEQYVVAGLITAIFGFMQFLAAPILGELSDIYGRKKLLVIGVGTLALAQLIFAAGIAFGSLLVLLLSRMLAGIAGANFSIAQATIADVTPPEKRAQNFGIIGAAFGVGFVIGPLLGGYLAGVTGNPATPFIFAGILGLINVVSISLFLQETHLVRSEVKKVKLSSAWHNIKKAYQDRETRPLYAASFLTMLGFGFFTAFISIFLAARFKFIETDIGLYFGIVGVWIIFAQVVVVRLLSNKYKGKTILIWSLPLLSVVIFLHPFVSNTLFLYLLMPFMSISFALFNTSLPALVSQSVSKDQQGAALGINGSLQALSQAIAPLAAGVFSGILGLTTSFFIGGSLVLIAFLIVRKIR